MLCLQLPFEYNYLELIAQHDDEQKKFEHLDEILYPTSEYLKLINFIITYDQNQDKDFYNNKFIKFC